MRFAICQELFEGWDWAKQCEFIAQTGYTGIEVAPFTLADRVTDITDAQLEDCRRIAEQNGLEIIGLHWLLAKTEGLHLTAPDASVRRATADYLVDLGRACGKLGGTLMVFGSPFQRNLKDGVNQEQALEYAIEVFQSALPRMADWGVEICMEPLTQKETDFVNTCAEAVELIDRVDQPNFTLHQDVKAMLGAESDSIPTLIDRYKDRVGHFHVNDTNLLGPGMGDTDYRPILAALRDSGYAGWVSVEVFDYSPGAEQIAQQSLQYMRSILEELDD